MQSNKNGRSRRHWILRASPAMVLAALVILTLSFVYSNRLYKLLGRTTSYVAKANVGQFEIGLSAQRSFEMPDHSKPTLRDIRISFPLSAESRGCELVYGAAIYTFPASSIIQPAQGQFAYSSPRYLIKFKYDLKNKRCESKDLFVIANDVPEKITVQFIKLDLTDIEVRESPQPEGIQISLIPSVSNEIAMNAISTTITAGSPFISASTNHRNKSFSVPKVRALSLLVHPYDSLNDYIIDETKHRIQKCKTTGVCDRILASVAKITDRRFLKVSEEARQAGMPIELVANFRYRLDMEADDIDSPAELLTYSPWMWLRGSPYSEYGAGHLPMHTKFVVFGDDLVVSSNPSLRAGVRNRSREYSIVYRDPAVVKIFSEIFSLVRTSLYYPLKVNLDDELVLLLNADRPRQYAVSIDKPYVAIDTEEGVRTSAYGALYEVLARSPAKLSLFMSPITNSCAPYRTQRCLFDVLEQRATAQKLEMLLNGYYYLPPAKRMISPLVEGPWTPPKFADALKDSAALNIFRNWFGPNLAQPRISIERSMAMSTHHERLALLGDEISILGSANWANTATVNTIEVIRSASLNSQLKQDVATFDEPWFVSSREDVRPTAQRYGDCDFIFEVATAKYTPPPSFIVTKDVILKELSTRFPQANSTNISIIEPRSLSGSKQEIGPDLNPVEQFAQNDLFSKRSLEDRNELRTSYACLEDSSSKTTYVIRLNRP